MLKFIQEKRSKIKIIRSHSSEFKSNPSGFKELHLVFSIDDKSILKTEIHAMPENELCLPELFSHLYSSHVDWNKQD